ncbi:hypothetical protein C8J57DRAFT_1283373 [Mycena rebaudengoi]|nr:hypothetical protein C8J57DRAFT_1283373 [Mycena rebaudengoi]
MNTATVFSSGRDLAAHYNIPANLPPPPRLTSTPQKPSPMAQFEALRAGYLAMRAEPPSESVAETVAPSDLSAPSEDAGVRAMREINDLIASPEFQSLGNDFDSPAFNEPSCFDFENYETSPLLAMDTPFDDSYLTSPMAPPYDSFDTSPPEDTPYTDFLPTPRLEGAEDSALLTGPLEDDLYGDMSLFGGEFDASEHWKETTPTLPTDATLYTLPPTSEPAPCSRSRSATGTRKNAALIPLEAPIQKRTYLTPSATSRRDVKKRAHSEAFADEGDVDVDTIEERRRKNTLAARVSRQRKLNRLRELEDETLVLRRERDVWRERAKMMGGMLRKAGVQFAEFED